MGTDTSPLGKFSRPQIFVDGDSPKSFRGALLMRSPAGRSPSESLRMASRLKSSRAKSRSFSGVGAAVVQVSMPQSPASAGIGTIAYSTGERKETIGVTPASKTSSAHSLPLPLLLSSLSPVNAVRGLGNPNSSPGKGAVSRTSPFGSMVTSLLKDQGCQALSGEAAPCNSARKRVPPALTSDSDVGQPLPKDQVDWLLSTLSEEERERFTRPLFLQDCHRRFKELDTDGTGFLDAGKLDAKLFDMFPTLRLDLTSGDRRIPGLENRIPNLLATFDSDMDGYIGWRDFFELMMYCQAWRKHFYVDIPLRKKASKPPAKPASGRRSLSVSGLTKVEPSSSPLPQLPTLAPSVTSQHQSASNGAALFAPMVGKKQASKRRRGTSNPANLKGASTSSFCRNSKPAAWENDSRPTSSASVTMRASGMFSSRSSHATGMLDSSRGAFYSSFLTLPANLGKFGSDMQR